MKQKPPIPFNQPYYTGKELANIEEAMKRHHLSGGGTFTQKCTQFFEKNYGFSKAILTTSCTDALEMAAVLLNLAPGDEVIAPSFTFPTTVIPFLRQGAKIVFADSSAENPNLDVSAIAPLITEKTKALIVVHYAGIACEMDTVLALAKKHGLFVIEDAAQAVNSYYNETPLGKLGHLGTFSFHEQKNICAGEGGLLAVNDPQFFARSEIIRDKGTNRAQFFRGEVDKYTWVDIGSSYLPSELNAAFLYGQLENLATIQAKRLSIWNRYFEGLKSLADQGYFQLPYLPSYATNNSHMFYLVCQSLNQRSELIAYLKQWGINAIFHYQPLHSSPFYKKLHGDRPLPHCDRYSNCLVRLPLFCDLSMESVDWIIEKVTAFFRPSAPPQSRILPSNLGQSDPKQTQVLSNSSEIR